jgi:putative transposase
MSRPVFLSEIRIRCRDGVFKAFRILAHLCIDSFAMPRRTPPLSTTFPYHVSARCINREWFQLPLSEVWKIMEDYLFFIHHAFQVEIMQFVLMPNHFHLLIRCPNGNLSETMKYFMRETSRQMTMATGRINQTYGTRFHRTLVVSDRYHRHVYKYIYRNPVKAGLCETPQEYPYSTLNGLLGQSKIHIPVHQDPFLFSPYIRTSTLEWLNRRPKQIHENEIKLALRRAIFEFPKFNQKTRRPTQLLTEDF